jgi:prepilin signal peptidase PulO-like enzyme (type II secretory pathway)
VAAALGGAAAGAAYGEYVRRTTQWESRGHFLAAGIPFYVLGATVGAAVGGIAAAPELLDRFPGVAAFVSLSGAIVGAGLVWLVRVLGRFAFAQEAMGFGDVKLMALLGALTGVGGILWTLALASVLGSVIGIARYACTRERQLPFGPFLIAGALAALLARTELKDFLDWYKSLVVRG